MRYLFFVIMMMPFVAHAVILNNSNAGIQAGNASNNTNFGNRVSSATPSVDVQVDNGGNVITTTASESEIAKQFMLELTTPILKTGVPNTVSPNTTQQCQNYDPANAVSAVTSGVPLMGKVFLCNHASKTGYYNKIFNQALVSYTAPKNTATGDATVPSSVYTMPNKSYTGYNDLVDSTVNAGGGFTTVSSGVVNGGSIDYIATRLIPLISKEFDYMTVKLPNYATDWANQVGNAQQQFQSELNTLLASLGISVTSPLPANFGATVDAALSGQYAQAQANGQAANNAAANGQTAGAAAGATGAAAGNNTAATVLAALGNITVPAAQQPLLDSVLADLSTSITQLATYNSKNALYVAQNKIYANNLNAYKAEKAKVAAPALYKALISLGDTSTKNVTDLYLGNPIWKQSTRSSCRNKTNTSKPESSTSCYKWLGYSVKSLSNVITLRTTYAPKNPPTFLLNKYSSLRYSHSVTTRPTVTLVSAATSGPNTTLLVKYKKAYQAASKKMATYKTQRDTALSASQQAFASAQTNLSSLQIALANAANNAPGLVDQYTQAAQGNLNNAGTGGSAAAGLAALDSLLQGLGGMINMANNVTNALVNNVAKADIDNASGVLVKAFKASMGVAGTLALGDGLATDAEIATFSAKATAPPTGGQAGVGSGVVAPANAAATHMRLNGLRDTPYRILKDVKVAIETLRTAMTMVAVATQGGGMTLQTYAPAPDVQPVTITSTDSSGIPIKGKLKVLGSKIKTALNI